MTGTLAFAFAAGAVATVNPCGFALLPAYLTRRLADNSRAGATRTAARALAVGALATVGFLAVFATAGSAIALGANALTGSFPWIGFVVGLVLVGLGVASMIGRQPVVLRVPHLGRQASSGRLRAEILFGVGYGLASLSCALPLFLATLGTALTGSLAASALSFAAYALGMGTVLTLLAVAVGYSRYGFARALRSLLPYIERASGAFLLAAGLYVADYWAVDLWRPGAGSFAAAPVSAGGRLATYVSTWLAGPEAKTALLVLAACLVTVALWSLRRPIGGRLRQLPRPDLGEAPRGFRRVAMLLALTVPVLTAATAALALIGPGRAGGPSSNRSALRGYRDPPAVAAPFALRDQFGQSVRLAGLRGRPVVIAFVYSHCRDTCPLAAADVHTAQQALGPDAARIAWLAISVDPRTDNAASVRAFSRHAGLLRSWRYLFRPETAVLRTLKAYGIQPQLTNASAAKEPFLQHSGYVALLDRTGRRIESFTDSSLTSADLAHDLRLILGERPAAPRSAAVSPQGTPAAPSSSFEATTPELAVRNGAVSFTGTDVVSGRTITLAGAAGKPVVLNAWASWCAGCAAEAPALAAFARSHPEVAVVGIDLEDQRRAATSFVRRFALGFPSIFDSDAVTAARLGISGLPTTLFLDRRHRIVSRIVGEASRGRFEAGLRKAEQP